MQLTAIIPKLPSRNLDATKNWYSAVLDAEVLGQYPYYLLLNIGGQELHFFLFRDLDPATNYGMCYLRTPDAQALYHTAQERNARMPELGHLEHKAWGLLEFSLLDPDTNLLTFGQLIEPKP